MLEISTTTKFDKETELARKRGKDMSNLKELNHIQAYLNNQIFMVQPQVTHLNASLLKCVTCG